MPTLNRSLTTPLISSIVLVSTLACGDGLDDGTNGSCALESITRAGGILRACSEIDVDITTLAHLGDVVVDSESGVLSFVQDPNHVLRYGIGFVTNTSMTDTYHLRLWATDDDPETPDYAFHSDIAPGENIWVAFDSSTTRVTVGHRPSGETSFMNLGVVDVAATGNEVELNCSGVARLDDCIPGSTGCVCDVDDVCSDMTMNCAEDGICRLPSTSCPTEGLVGAGCACESVSDCESGLELDCINSTCQKDTRALRNYVTLYEDRTVELKNVSDPSDETVTGPSYRVWEGRLTVDAGENPYAICPANWTNPEVAMFDWVDTQIVLHEEDSVGYSVGVDVVVLGFTQDVAGEPSEPTSFAVDDRQIIKIADTTQDAIRFERLSGCDMEYRSAAIPFAVTSDASDEYTLVNCIEGDVEIYFSSDTSGEALTLTSGQVAKQSQDPDGCNQAQLWFIDKDDPTAIVKKKTSGCN